MYWINLPDVVAPDFETKEEAERWIRALGWEESLTQRMLDAIEPIVQITEVNWESARIVGFTGQYEPPDDDDETLEEIVDLLKAVVSAQEGMTTMVRELVNVVRLQGEEIKRLQNGSSHE